MGQFGGVLLALAFVASAEGSPTLGKGALDLWGDKEGKKGGLFPNPAWPTPPDTGGAAQAPAAAATTVLDRAAKTEAATVTSQGQKVDGAGDEPADLVVDPDTTDAGDGKGWITASSPTKVASGFGTDSGNAEATPETVLHVSGKAEPVADDAAASSTSAPPEAVVNSAQPDREDAPAEAAPTAPLSEGVAAANAAEGGRPVDNVATREFESGEGMGIGVEPHPAAIGSTAAGTKLTSADWDLARRHMTPLTAEAPAPEHHAPGAAAVVDGGSGDAQAAPVEPETGSQAGQPTSDAATTATPPDASAAGSATGPPTFLGKGALDLWGDKEGNKGPSGSLNAATPSASAWTADAPSGPSTAVGHQPDSDREAAAAMAPAPKQPASVPAPASGSQGMPAPQLAASTPSDSAADSSPASADPAAPAEPTGPNYEQIHKYHPSSIPWVSAKKDADSLTATADKVLDVGGQHVEPTYADRAAKAHFGWYGPLFEKTGFASETRSYLLLLDGRVPGLAAHQFQDSDTDEHVRHTLPAHEREVMTRLVENGNNWDAPPTVTVCASPPWRWFGDFRSHDHDGRPGESCPPSDEGVKVGRTMFETDNIPPSWVPNLNRMDEVWVPSHFNTETFANAGVTTRLWVLPEAIDTETQFNPINVKTPFSLPDVGGPHGGYKFLSVGKWEHRKGMDVLLRAYLAEFTALEPVVLYIKTQKYGSLSPRADFKRLQEEMALTMRVKTELLPKVHLIEDLHIGEAELPSLYKAVDAFVLPTRGEGWGRPPAEAMAMGLPTILTRWGGQTEYMDDNVVLGIDATPVRLTQEDMVDMMGVDGPTHLRGHNWAEPDRAQVRLHMRWCMEHPLEARAMGHRAREHMRSKFSLKAVADKLVKHVEEISGGGASPVHVAYHA